MNEHKTRGRPRTFDREAALETAMSLFWRHGYEGTSIADLTNAMGVTPPTLYAVFGSKDQLYRDVLFYYIRRNEAGRARLLGDDISAYEMVASYLRLAAAAFTDPSSPAGCMVSTASLNCAVENASAHEAAMSIRAANFATFEAKLAWAKEQGEIPIDTDTTALVRFYTAIVQGMSVQAIDGATVTDLNGLVDIALAAWPGKHKREIM